MWYTPSDLTAHGDIERTTVIPVFGFTIAPVAILVFSGLVQSSRGAMLTMITGFTIGLAFRAAVF
ncbi:MAG: hypothetical protein CMK92_03365 [Pseudomonas sp.]|nr:hypothetical protein [Pseudomonas sp.]